MPTGKKANAHQGFDELKLKYLTVDRNYEALKTLTRRALFEFDQLKKKSIEDSAQLEREKLAHESAVKELEDIQVEYEKLKETSAKAFDQYGEMVGRYEKQLELKEKAETLATNLSHENKILTRNVDSMSQIGQTENKKLLSQLEEFTMENSALKQEVDDLKESMELLTTRYGAKDKDHKSLERQLSHAAEKVAEMEKQNEDKVLVDKDAFERLQKASEMALEEINSLSDKLEVEQMLRREAEHIAHQHMSEANALKRQSAIVLSSVIEEQQLTKALMEMETLTNKMSEAEKEAADKIADLEGQIETLKESTLLEENRKLEEKLTLVTAEAESLAANSQVSEQKVSDLQAKVSECEQQVADLTLKVEEAEQAAATAAANAAATAGGSSGGGGAPPPPPPPPPPVAAPPPPPPPPPVAAPPPGFTTSLSNLVKVKKPPGSPSTERKPSLAEEDPMAEMLARIKSGNVHLRKIDAVTSEKKKPENDIMAEMSKLLASGKRPGARSRAPPATKPKPRSSDSGMSDELFSKLKKRKVQQGEDVTDTAKTEGEIDSSRENSAEPLVDDVIVDNKDADTVGAKDDREAAEVDDKGTVDAATTDQSSKEEEDVAEVTKQHPYATVKERMNTLNKVKEPHPPLEKRTSSKLKIPNVFQSPQDSPLTPHKSSITDISIHVSYDQEDDELAPPVPPRDVTEDEKPARPVPPRDVAEDEEPAPPVPPRDVIEDEKPARPVPPRDVAEDEEPAPPVPPRDVADEKPVPPVSQREVAEFEEPAPPIPPRGVAASEDMQHLPSDSNKNAVADEDTGKLVDSEESKLVDQSIRTVDAPSSQPKDEAAEKGNLEDNQVVDKEAERTPAEPQTVNKAQEVPISSDESASEVTIETQEQSSPNEQEMVTDQTGTTTEAPADEEKPVTGEAPATVASEGQVED